MKVCLGFIVKGAGQRKGKGGEGRGRGDGEGMIRVVEEGTVEKRVEVCVFIDDGEEM